MTKHETYNLLEIGKRLRQLRAYQHKTQVAMSKELGISLSHYSKLEIGIGGMSHGLALALCRQFSIPEEWFIYGTGPEPDLSNLKVPARIRQTSAPASHPISDEQLNGIIDIILQDNFKELAQSISDTMSIPLSRAMVMLIKEKLRGMHESHDNRAESFQH